MEFEIICDKCKEKYHIISEGYEKTAKSTGEVRIDFGNVKIDLNKKAIVTKCPKCSNTNEEELSDLGISTYILYVTDVINCDKANNILNEFRKEIEIENNPRVKLMMEELHNMHIKEVYNRCKNNIFNLNDFNNAVEIIRNN